MTLPAGLSREAILLALSAERQAQATNDPLRRVQLGLADGVKDRFLTPFVEASTATVYLAGVKQESGWSLSSGTGTDGRDEIVFSPVPASGMVSVTADNRAVNLIVLDLARDDAWQTVVRYMPPGTNLSDVGLLAKLVPIAIRQVKLAFRGRRDQDIPDALDAIVKADLEWLRAARDGKVSVPVTGATSGSPTEVYATAEPSAFGTLSGNLDEENAF